MTAWSRLTAIPVAKLASVAEGSLAIVRGAIRELGGTTVEAPVALPEGAPPAERIAVAQIAVDETPRMGWRPPLRELHERVRPFVLEDATGRARVRFRDDERDLLEVRIDGPFVEGRAGKREVYLRTVSLAEEVIVVGRVGFEVDAGGLGGGYREPARIPTVDAAAVFDRAAWESREAWRRLPWHRKLSLIVRNR